MFAVFEDLGLWTIVGLVLALLLVLVLLRLSLAAWRRFRVHREVSSLQKDLMVRKVLSKLSRGGEEGAEAKSELSLKLALIDLTFKQGLEAIEKQRHLGRRKSWYVLLGEPSCGKSTLLEKSGCNLVNAQSTVTKTMAGIASPGSTAGAAGAGAGAAPGVGAGAGTGTGAGAAAGGGAEEAVGGAADNFEKPALQFYVGRNQVVLDVSGRVFFDHWAGGSCAEYAHICEQIGKKHHREPLRGIMLCIPADALLADDSRLTQKKALLMLEELWRLTNTISQYLPCYVIITKLDVVLGCREYFESLNDELKDQAVGVINPYGEQFDATVVEQFFTMMTGRIAAGAMSLFTGREVFNLSYQGRSRLDKTAGMYLFARNFERLQSNLLLYLNTIFTPQTRNFAFFRGLFVTSAQDGGYCLDPEFARMAGQSIDDALYLARNFNHERSLFVREMLEKQIFADQVLSHYNHRAQMQHDVPRYLTAAALGLCSAWFIYGAVVTGPHMSRLLQGEVAYYQSLSQLLEQRVIERAPLIGVSRRGAGLTMFDLAMPHNNNVSRLSFFSEVQNHLKHDFGLPLSMWPGALLSGGWDFGSDRSARSFVYNQIQTNMVYLPLVRSTEYAFMQYHAPFTEVSRDALFALMAIALYSDLNSKAMTNDSYYPAQARSLLAFMLPGITTNIRQELLYFIPQYDWYSKANNDAVILDENYARACRAAIRNWEYHWRNLEQYHESSYHQLSQDINRAARISSGFEELLKLFHSEMNSVTSDNLSSFNQRMQQLIDQMVADANSLRALPTLIWQEYQRNQTAPGQMLTALAGTALNKAAPGLGDALKAVPESSQTAVPAVSDLTGGSGSNGTDAAGDKTAVAAAGNSAEGALARLKQSAAQWTHGNNRRSSLTVEEPRSFAGGVADSYVTVDLPGINEAAGISSWQEDYVGTKEGDFASVSTGTPPAGAAAVVATAAGAGAAVGGGDADNPVAAANQAAAGGAVRGAGSEAAAGTADITDTTASGLAGSKVDDMVTEEHPVAVVPGMEPAPRVRSAMTPIADRGWLPDVSIDSLLDCSYSSYVELLRYDFAFFRYFDNIRKTHSSNKTGVYFGEIDFASLLAQQPELEQKLARDYARLKQDYLTIKKGLLFSPRKIFEQQVTDTAGSAPGASNAMAGAGGAAGGGASAAGSQVKSAALIPELVQKLSAEELVRALALNYQLLAQFLSYCQVGVDLEEFNERLAAAGSLQECYELLLNGREHLNGHAQALTEFVQNLRNDFLSSLLPVGLKLINLSQQELTIICYDRLMSYYPEGDTSTAVMGNLSRMLASRPFALNQDHPLYPYEFDETLATSLNLREEYNPGLFIKMCRPLLFLEDWLKSGGISVAKGHLIFDSSDAGNSSGKSQQSFLNSMPGAATGAAAGTGGGAGAGAAAGSGSTGSDGSGKQQDLMLVYQHMEKDRRFALLHQVFRGYARSMLDYYAHFADSVRPRLPSYSEFHDMTRSSSAYEINDRLNTLYDLSRRTIAALDDRLFNNQGLKLKQQALKHLEERLNDFSLKLNDSGAAALNLWSMMPADALRASYLLEHNPEFKQRLIRGQAWGLPWWQSLERQGLALLQQEAVGQGTLTVELLLNRLNAFPVAKDRSPERALKLDDISGLYTAFRYLGLNEEPDSDPLAALKKVGGAVGSGGAGDAAANGDMLNGTAAAFPELFNSRQVKHQIMEQSELDHIFLKSLNQILSALSDTEEPGFELFIPEAARQNQLYRNSRYDLPLATLTYRYVSASGTGTLNQGLRLATAHAQERRLYSGLIHDPDLTLSFYEYSNDTDAQGRFELTSYPALQMYLAPGTVYDKKERKAYVPISFTTNRGKFVIFIGLTFDHAFPTPDQWPRSRDFAP